MKTIQDINFDNKRALIRVDFNVPLNKDGEVTDNTRIKAAIPTIKLILEKGGSVVLMSHLGRPKNGAEEKFSLKHVVKSLESLIGTDVTFIDDCISDKAFEITKNLSSGKVVLLENLRFYSEEKDGNLEFAKKLSQHGDIYINDAFGTAHREHASTAIIAEFFPENKYFGLLLEKEIKNIDALLKSPQAPTTAIIGGAKVSSKISIIEKLIDTVDQIIIGGGMAYTFVKAQGGQVGDSLVEDDYLQTALEVLSLAKEKDVQIHLPIDTIVADRFANDAMEKFKNGTAAVANALVNATDAGAFTLIGGGDSVSAINQLNLAERVSYVSTGGGAMLEYLEGIELPGIKAILN